MAILKVITGPLRHKIFQLDPLGFAKVLGRHRKQSDFAIPDTAVSRKHAELSFRDGQWAIRDLNSANGTFLNEQRIPKMTLLHHNDQIRCGATVLLFESNVSQVSDQSAQMKAEDDFIELVFDPGETMIAVSLDTAQHRESLLQKERMIEAGQAALKISHGIKNTLQAISSGVDVVDQGFEHKNLEQAQRGWKILRRNLKQVQNLILDMLKFSKEQKLHIQPCYLNRLVETILEIARPQAADRSVKLSCHVDEHIDIAYLDPDRIQDVIYHILKNAIEAVTPQKGHVTISTQLASDNTELIIRIEDNGPGIENLDQIFEPFESYWENAGNGLGLAISQKIIAQHNGQIEVNSIPGEGSIFIVRLPFKTGATE